MTRSEDLRNFFVQFFEQHDHKHLSSSKLLPSNDPSLLFTNAGMVQFKNWFTGEEKPKFKNVVSHQKCIRAGGKHNDLDNVGFTPRHHTFFEMLGNFSFGSYFKEQAIILAWNFLVKELNIDKKKIYVTVYKEDEESFKIWKQVSGFPESKLIRISTYDNFWSMGETGPCGPCSEIFFDQGTGLKGGLPGSKDHDGPRFIELWNLVFMEFNQQNGKLIKLPKKCVDTGMGLERLLAVLNGKQNNFETDYFMDLINFISKETGICITKKNIHSFRIIADHIRAIVFILSEGILPSNEGRGYVLRRIIRRAARQLSEMEYCDIFLYKLVSIVSESFKKAYSELKHAEEFIIETLKQEEKNFSKTIYEGNKLLLEEIKKCKTKNFPAELVFKLYDTYGFPVDLTEIILKRENFTVDQNQLDKFFKEQKKKSKKTWSGSGETSKSFFFSKLQEKFLPTDFVGYQTYYQNSKLLAIIKDEKFLKKNPKDKDCLAIFDSTPFYAESGGQIGDTGFVRINQRKAFEILDTQKVDGNIFLHTLKTMGGEELVVDRKYDLEINNQRRKKITNNHSATHLLHESLRRVLGKHVNQRGSLVAKDKLRFDFTNPKPLHENEKKEVENIVNKSILDNLEIKVLKLPLKQAFESGAIGLFGEKYPEIVRVVKMEGKNESENFFSSELCGGTHVLSTGEIGSFKIISESSVSSGIRRIEAITGDNVLKRIDYNENLLKKIRESLKTSNENIIEKINALKEVIKKYNSHNTSSLENLINKSFIRNVRKKSLYAQMIEISSRDIKSYSDLIKNSLDPDVILLVSKDDSKVSILVSLKNTKNLKNNAIEIVKRLVPMVGGKGGGGRPELAQGGGPNKLGIKDVMSEIDKLI